MIAHEVEQRLANDYWLYVVFHRATDAPNINLLGNPATLEWQPVELHKERVARAVERTGNNEAK